MIRDQRFIMNTCEKKLKVSFQMINNKTTKNQTKIILLKIISHWQREGESLIGNQRYQMKMITLQSSLGIVNIENILSSFKDLFL